MLLNSVSCGLERAGGRFGAVSRGALSRRGGQRARRLDQTRATRFRAQAVSVGSRGASARSGPPKSAVTQTRAIADLLSAIDCIRSMIDPADTPRSSNIERAPPRNTSRGQPRTTKDSNADLLVILQIFAGVTSRHDSNPPSGIAAASTAQKGRRHRLRPRSYQRDRATSGSGASASSHVRASRLFVGGRHAAAPICLISVGPAT